MRALDINKENLDNQIGTVSEERKQGVDNQPYGKTSEALDDLAYKNFAYHHSVIGSIDDLRAATVDDVAAFFKMYYAPNNAVLAIVGRRQDRRVPREGPHSTSSRSPGSPTPPAVDIDRAAADRRSGGRRSTIRWRELARIDIVYHIPPSMTPDADALSVAAHDPVRRAQFPLLRDDRPAEAAVVERGARRPARAAGPGCSASRGMANPGKSIADLEQAIYDEVERLKAGPIEAWEIEKARNAAQAQLRLAASPARCRAP